MRLVSAVLSVSILLLAACDKDPLTQDNDADGFLGAEDCDDANAAVNPAATETCNNIDDNCDGTVDEGVKLTYYRDDDGDGFGGEEAVEACALPEGASETRDDCDDADADQSPDATERCNDEDDDCDGTVDEDAVDIQMFYADTDGDGFGDADSSVEACSTPSGYVANDTDCDDGRDATYPGADERCNDLDDDCDGDTDEPSAIDAATWFGDGDGDGYGDPDAPQIQCEQPEGYVDNASDCDDAESLAWTGADEVCYDSVDNDCDGTVDNDDAVDAPTWYADSDGDGYGNAVYSKTSCEQLEGYVDNTDDCDDTESLAWTGADEVCDEVDNDCDGTADNDDALDASTWYEDGDGDGYGDPDTATTACGQPSGYVDDDQDCDDIDSDVNPSADEVCDGVDNDCDSATSEDGMVSQLDGSGGLTDISAEFTGTSGSPASVTLSDDGEVVFCDGTYYVNLAIEADVDLTAQNGVDSVTLDGDAFATVVDVQTDGVTVSLTDLTIQNGEGTSVCYSSYVGCGGGVSCSADSTTSMRIDGVTFLGNSAFFGGGLNVSGCSVEMSDSVLTTGSATYGGGFWIDEGGSLSVVDSDIHSNDASYGGGFVSYGFPASSVPPSVSLDGTMVYDNTAVTEGGGAWLYDSDTTCDGSTADAGFVGNTAGNDSGGLWISESSSTFTATNCDFGAAASADDNAVYDIASSVSPGFVYWAGDDATFTCEDARCGSLESTTMGGSTGTTSARTTELFGNIVTSDSIATIESFDSYLTSTGGCTVDFYVMSNTSVTDSGWEVLFAELGNTVSSTGGYVNSGEVGLAVESGTVYMLAMATTCTSGGLTYHYDTTSPLTDGGFGSNDAYGYDGTFTSTLSVGDSYDLGGGAFSTYGAGVFDQIANYIEL